MSLKKLFVISYTFIVLGVIVLGILSMIMSQNQKVLNEKQEQRYYSYQLADELRQSSDDLTRLARTYVISGESKYEKMYWDILAIRNGEKPRPEHYDRIYWDLVLNYGEKPRSDGEAIPLQQLMKKAGFTKEEFAKLQKAQNNSDGLVTTETIAMNAVKGLYDDGNGNYTKQGEPDFEMARRIMHDEQYHNDKASIMKPIDEFFMLLNERTNTEVQLYITRGNRLLVLIQTLVAVLAVLATGIGISVTRRILRQVGGEPVVIMEIAQRIARGDLIENFKTGEQNLVGIFAAIREMTERLREIVADVKGAAENVASGSQAMSSSATEMSQGATEQAAAAEQASSSMEEMAANIRQNSENAQQTERIAVQAAQNAEVSGRAVAETVEAMKTITQKVAIIEEIARQTHMLSLNATIEAARAQEYGKGFGVVAAEVRELAERSRTAATEINQLATSSVTVAEKAGEMLNTLVPNIQKTAELVQEISAASSEQNKGTAQINSAIQQLDDVIQQNSAASEEMSATAEELASQAEYLQGTIAFFKIDKTTQKKQKGTPHAPGTDARANSAAEKANAGGTPDGHALNLNKTGGYGDAKDADFERF